MAQRYPHPLIDLVAVILLTLPALSAEPSTSGAMNGSGSAPSAHAQRPTVAVVRSDYADLADPVPPEQALTAVQIESLVRQACVLGGLPAVVERAIASRGSDSLWVAIKPNIVEVRKSGSGDITDVRVVRGIVRVVHELAPAARISVAEGGAWIPPERKEVLARVPFAEVGDGFAVAGYRDLLTDPALAGINLDLIDLNYDDPQEVKVPGKGYSQDSFFIPRTVRECDLLIDAPVLKIIGVVQMTVAMKNFIGIAPGMIYGWSKSAGYPPDTGHGIPHHNAILGETISDLTALSGVDFTVVDAVVGKERARIDDDGGRPVRLNTVVAGADIVAVDAVSAGLMGLNPADVEYITLGERRGLGVGRLEAIEVKGQSLAQVGRRFEKYPADWGEAGERGHYGQGNRTWLVHDAIPAAEWREGLVSPSGPAPVPGEGGWSGPVYFPDDKIDLDRYYGRSTQGVAYAYGEFEAPEARDAELWLGSDEGLRVWLNGESVYRFEGRRRHRLPNDRVPVVVRAGRNTCLVEVRQQRGPCEFSLKVCEPEADPRYDGRTLTGLRYTVPPGNVPTREVSAVVSQESRHGEWYEEVYVQQDPTAAGRVSLSGFMPGQAEAGWVGLGEPLVWGRAMELTAKVDSGLVIVESTNLRAFHLVGQGPLSMVAEVRVQVDSSAVVTTRLGTGETAILTAVVDKTGRIERWKATRSAGGTGEETVAELPDSLSHLPVAPDRYDTPLGSWCTDAIRWATGADLVFQNNGGIRTSLAAGPLTTPNLFAMNWPDEIHLLRITGREVLAILEQGLREGGEGPLQISGFRYTCDHTRPPGSRVISATLHPDRVYTVAAEDYICMRGAARYFGREIEHTPSGVHVVDAHVRYARHQGRVVAPSDERIREVR